MKEAICLLIFSLAMLGYAATAQVRKSSPKSTKKKNNAKVQYGTASFYHDKFNGRRTASGEIFSQKKLTAAHNSVPLGTWLKVTNLRNKKTVVVKVTDRLHYRNKRLLDLSRAAAVKISFSKSGLLPVKVEILGKTKPLAADK